MNTEKELDTITLVEDTETSLENDVTETMDDFKNELEKSFRKLSIGDMITGTILSITEEELVADLKYYTQGIVPVSEISGDPGLHITDVYHIGDEIVGTILSMDDGQGNIRLSMKEANEISAWGLLKGFKNTEKVVAVKVSESVKSGVIAYLQGIRGFIPASQLSLSFVEHTEEWLGRELEVVVITVDEADKKLVLSAKQVLKSRQVEETATKIAHLVPGSILEGTVETIMPYGAFINLGGGLSGLLHISRISQRRIKSPSEVLKVGESIKVKLIDIKDNKISLSRKELEDDYAVEADTTELFDYKETEAVTTSLGSLFAKLKL